MLTVPRLTTSLGEIALLGEIAGRGRYEDLVAHATEVEAFGVTCRCVTLPKLIALKRAAGRRATSTPSRSSRSCSKSSSVWSLSGQGPTEVRLKLKPDATYYFARYDCFSRRLSFSTSVVRL